MLTSRTSDLTNKSLKISSHPKEHHHHKFFSKRLITRDQLSMAANNNINLSSFEDYHGGSSVSVPFIWESQPGTPKVKFRDNPANNLPPLTPPPSYRYSPVTQRSSPYNNITRKTSPKANILQTIFSPKQFAAARRKRFPPSPSLSPSSSSSSPRSNSSVSSSPVVSKTPSLKSRGWRMNIISSPRLSVDSRVDGGDHEDEDQEYGSPVSTLCFGRGVANTRSRSGCYSSLIKVLLN